MDRIFGMLSNDIKILSFKCGDVNISEVLHLSTTAKKMRYKKYETLNDKFKLSCCIDYYNNINNAVYDILNNKNNSNKHMTFEFKY